MKKRSLQFVGLLLISLPVVSLQPSDAIKSRVLEELWKMAAPHVSRIVALMLERNPNLKASQVIEIVAKT